MKSLLRSDPPDPSRKTKAFDCRTLYGDALRRKRYAILETGKELSLDEELKLFAYFESKGFEFIQKTFHTVIYRNNTYPVTNYQYYFRRKGIIWS